MMEHVSWVPPRGTFSMTLEKMCSNFRSFWVLSVFFIQSILPYWNQASSSKVKLVRKLIFQSRPSANLSSLLDQLTFHTQGQGYAQIKPLLSASFGTFDLNFPRLELSWKCRMPGLTCEMTRIGSTSSFSFILKVFKWVPICRSLSHAKELSESVNICTGKLQKSCWKVKYFPCRNMNPKYVATLVHFSLEVSPHIDLILSQVADWPNHYFYIHGMYVGATLKLP